MKITPSTPYIASESKSILATKFCVTRSLPLGGVDTSEPGLPQSGMELYLRPLRPSRDKTLTGVFNPGLGEALVAAAGLPTSTLPESPPAAQSGESLEPKNQESTFTKLAMSAIAEASPAYVAKNAWDMISVMKDTTQPHLESYFVNHGVPPDIAEKYSTSVMSLCYQHQRTVDAMFVGVATGGAAYWVLGRTKMGPSWRVSLAACVGLVFATLYVWLAHTPSPFYGVWVQNVAQSRYEVGSPPRVATLRISEQPSGLEINDDALLSDGGQQHLKYVLTIDGKDHPDLSNDGANQISAAVENNALNIVHKSQGVVQKLEQYQLSIDRHTMTVTSTMKTASGSEQKNVAVYEKK